MESTVRLLSSYAVILAVMALGLAVITVYSRRTLSLKVTALGLTVGVMVIGYLAFRDLPGRAKYLSIDSFRSGFHCSKVHYVDARERKGITLIVERHASSGREYVELPWNLRLAQSLEKSKRAQADSKRKGAIFYGGKSCQQTFDEGEEGQEGREGKKKTPRRQLGGDEQDQEEDFGFHAEPPPPAPEKQYE